MLTCSHELKCEFSINKIVCHSNVPRKKEKPWKHTVWFLRYASCSGGGYILCSTVQFCLFRFCFSSHIQTVNGSYFSELKSCSAEKTALCPQQCMKQQSPWLLNHISTHPIKQWSFKLGPKSRHKAHSWAIESIWLRSLLHHTHRGPEFGMTPDMEESISLSHRSLSACVWMPMSKNPADVACSWQISPTLSL